MRFSIAATWTVGLDELRRKVVEAGAERMQRIRCVLNFSRPAGESADYSPA